MANTHKRRKQVRKTKRKQPRVLRKRRPKKTTIRRRKMQRGGSALDIFKKKLGDAWGTFNTFRRNKKPSVPAYAPSALSTFPTHSLSGISDLHQAVRKLQQDTATTQASVEQHRQQLQTLIAQRTPQPQLARPQLPHPQLPHPQLPLPQPLHSQMPQFGTPALAPAAPTIVAPRATVNIPHSLASTVGPAPPFTTTPLSTHIAPRIPSPYEHSQVQEAPERETSEREAPGQEVPGRSALLRPYRPYTFPSSPASTPSPMASSHLAHPNPAVSLTRHLEPTYPPRSPPSLARYPSSDTSEPYRPSLQRLPSSEPA